MQNNGLAEILPPDSNTGVVNTYGGHLRVLVDWVQATFPKNISISEVFDILELEKGLFTEQPTGMMGYKKQLRFGHISILYDGNTDDMGTHLVMSGQGCREYEQYKKNSWEELFAMILDSKGHFSRLDLAIDDFKPYWTLRQVKMKLKKGETRSKFKSTVEITTREIDTGKEIGDTIYFGSAQSMVRIVMYAKDLERVHKGHECPPDIKAWNRCEIRTRNERADKLADLLTQYREGKIGELAAAVLRNYVEFLQRGNDSNKSRWKVVDWWEEYLNYCGKQRLSQKAPDRTIERTDAWISHQVETALSMIFIAFDRDLGKMMQYIDSGFGRLTDKEWQIIKQYKANEMTEEELEEFIKQEMQFVESIKIRKSACDRL